MLQDRFHILVVKLAAIGDVVMALPLVSALKKRYPDSHITWVVGSIAAPLLRAIPLIDQIIEVNETALLKGSLAQRIRTIGKLWNQIGGRSVDLVLTLHSDPRYRILTWPVRCRDKRSWSHTPLIPGRYHAQECLRLFDQEEGATERLLEYPSIQLPPSPVPVDGRPLVILAPGGAKNTLADNALRRWPVTHYAELARLLSPKARILLTGSASDAWVAPHFQCENWIGRLELTQLVALLKQSSLLITHDSGPLHLAKLVKTPTLALFGPTNPSSFTSRQENVEVLWGGERLSCRPCYNGKTYAACTNNICLKNISPEAVAARAAQICLWKLKKIARFLGTTSKQVHDA